MRTKWQGSQNQKNCNLVCLEVFHRSNSAAYLNPRPSSLRLELNTPPQIHHIIQQAQLATHMNQDAAMRVQLSIDGEFRLVVGLLALYHQCDLLIPFGEDVM